MNARIVDLRYHMKDVLRAIDRGETVTILHRGKPRATLTPITLACTSAPSVMSQPSSDYGASVTTWTIPLPASAS